MAEYCLFSGDPRGRRCSGCREVLSPHSIIYEWRGRLYELGCFLDLLTSVAPADPYVYSPPGEDWKAP